MLRNLVVAFIVLAWTVEAVNGQSENLKKEQERAIRLLELTKDLAKPASTGKPPSPNPNNAQGPGTTQTQNPLPAESSAPQGIAKRLALVVGINNYQAVTRLNGCVNDAQKMQQLLTTRYEFEPGNVKVLLNEQATHEAIVKAFQNI